MRQLKNYELAGGRALDRFEHKLLLNYVFLIFLRCLPNFQAFSGFSIMRVKLLNFVWPKISIFGHFLSSGSHRRAHNPMSTLKNASSQIDYQKAKNKESRPLRAVLARLERAKLGPGRPQASTPGGSPAPGCLLTVPGCQAGFKPQHYPFNPTQTTFLY